MQDISDLMDGELDIDTAARQIARLKSDSTAREAWDGYHLIGDAMRGQSSHGPASATAFCVRLAEVLANEPTVLAPQRTRLTEKSRWQTVALSAAASLAALAVVGGVSYSLLRQDDQLTTVAAVSVPAKGAKAPTALALVGPATQGEPRTEPFVTAAAAGAAGTTASASAPAPSMHEYLLAHQGISPTTAFQGVTPYIRTVSDNDSDD
jgi:sigma-E factor negative regulatory protein RseA